MDNISTFLCSNAVLYAKKDGCHSSHSRSDWHKVATILIIPSPLSFFHSAIVKDLEVEWCERNKDKRCNVGDSIRGYGDRHETIASEALNIGNVSLVK